MSDIRTLYELDVHAPFVDLTADMHTELDDGRCLWWRSGSGALVMITHVQDQSYPWSGIVPVMVRENRFGPLDGFDDAPTPLVIGGATSCGLWEQSLWYRSSPPVLVYSTPSVEKPPQVAAQQTDRFAELLQRAHATMPSCLLYTSDAADD